MLAQLTTYRCKASTVLEAIVAALILLLSFSAGIVIYNKVMLSGRSSAALGASYSQRALADSLIRTSKFPIGELRRAELTHSITLQNYPVLSGLQVLEIITTDQTGKKLTELRRIIPKSHE
jgi:hypothetical protein